MHKLAPCAAAVRWMTPAEDGAHVAAASAREDRVWTMVLCAISYAAAGGCRRTAIDSVEVVATSLQSLG